MTLLWCLFSNIWTSLFDILEKEMATHSSVLAWRIPGTGEPGGLQSMGLHRVGHDWSDLAAVAVAVWYTFEDRMINLVCYSILTGSRSWDYESFYILPDKRWGTRKVPLLHAEGQMLSQGKAHTQLFVWDVRWAICFLDKILLLLERITDWYPDYSDLAIWQKFVWKWIKYAYAFKDNNQQYLLSMIKLHLSSENWASLLAQSVKNLPAM